MKLDTLSIIAAIIGILCAFGVVFLLIADIEGWFTKKPTLTLSTTKVTFPDLGVTIQAEDIKEMNAYELSRYASLLYYTERFNTTKEETRYLAMMLLPRFFIVPEEQTISDETTGSIPGL